MNEVYGTRTFGDVIPHTDDIFDTLLEIKKNTKDYYNAHITQISVPILLFARQNETISMVTI